jgi:histidine phosphotransferase ChpT
MRGSAGEAGLLRRSIESGTIDAHAIQPYYTGLLARACGLSVDLVAEGDTVTVATR